jgi:hypothetical protein
MSKRIPLETKEIRGVLVHYFSDSKSEWVEALCPHCGFERSIDIQQLDMGPMIASQINNHIRQAHPQSSCPP